MSNILVLNARLKELGLAPEKGAGAVARAKARIAAEEARLAAEKAAAEKVEAEKVEAEKAAAEKVEGPRVLMVMGLGVREVVVEVNEKEQVAGIRFLPRRKGQQELFLSREEWVEYASDRMGLNLSRGVTPESFLTMEDADVQKHVGAYLKWKERQQELAQKKGWRDERKALIVDVCHQLGQLRKELTRRGMPTGSEMGTSSGFQAMALDILERVGMDEAPADKEALQHVLEQAREFTKAKLLEHEARMNERAKEERGKRERAAELLEQFEAREGASKGLKALKERMVGRGVSIKDPMVKGVNAALVATRSGANPIEPLAGIIDQVLAWIDEEKGKVAAVKRAEEMGPPRVKEVVPVAPAPAEPVGAPKVPEAAKTEEKPGVPAEPKPTFDEEAVDGMFALAAQEGVLVEFIHGILAVFQGKMPAIEAACKEALRLVRDDAAADLQPVFRPLSMFQGKEKVLGKVLDTALKAKVPAPKAEQKEEEKPVETKVVEQRKQDAEATMAPAEERKAKIGRLTAAILAFNALMDGTMGPVQDVLKEDFAWLVATSKDPKSEDSLPSYVQRALREGLRPIERGLNRLALEKKGDRVGHDQKISVGEGQQAIAWTAVQAAIQEFFRANPAIHRRMVMWAQGELEAKFGGRTFADPREFEKVPEGVNEKMWRKAVSGRKGYVSILKKMLRGNEEAAKVIQGIGGDSFAYENHGWERRPKGMLAQEQHAFLVERLRTLRLEERPLHWQGNGRAETWGRFALEAIVGSIHGQILAVKEESVHPMEWVDLVTNLDAQKRVIRVSEGKRGLVKRTVHGIYAGGRWVVRLVGKLKFWGKEPQEEEKGVETKTEEKKGVWGSIKGALHTTFTAPEGGEAEREGKFKRYGLWLTRKVGQGARWLWGKAKSHPKTAIGVGVGLVTGGIGLMAHGATWGVLGASVGAGLLGAGGTWGVQAANDDKEVVAAQPAAA